MSAPIINMLSCCQCQKIAKSLQLCRVDRLFDLQRKYCTVVNHKWKIEPLVDRELNDEKYKHKRHPGALGVSTIKIPDELGGAIRTVNERNPVQNVKEKAISLSNYLWRRELPLREEDRVRFSQQFEEKFRSRDLARYEKMTEEEKEVYDENLEHKVRMKINKVTYHWQPIRFDAINGILYMNGRLFYDYACLYKVFHEISQRLPDFQPKSLFDFGSGVGTTTWAANTIWKNTLKEHFGVDTSEDMNKINQLLLRDGDENDDPHIPGVYLRQFFPFSTGNQYDIVVSAFSLFELPTVEDRLHTLTNLWKKTEQFLVIIENGSNAGFQVIMEARSLILQYSKSADLVEMNGHVFSPCPHEQKCPKLLEAKRTPCNFSVSYSTAIGNKPGETKSANFSYVVLRKGNDTDEVKWPRLVRHNRLGSKHVHCWTCTADGRLEQATFTTAKHGKNLFRCAKKSELGDLLPVVPKEEDQLEYKLL